MLVERRMSLINLSEIKVQPWQGNAEWQVLLNLITNITIFAIIGDNEDSIGKNLFIIFFIKSKDC